MNKSVKLRQQASAKELTVDTQFMITSITENLYLKLVGCAKFNVPLDTFLGHFGNSGVTASSARIIAAASAEASSPAQPHSVCGVE